MRVDNERGKSRGAGVLLSDRHVVTCAHILGPAEAVTGEEPGVVRISSTVCRPEWSSTARVVPGSWVYRGSQRGDVVLLELDEPTPCGAAATLWRAPLSAGRVHAYGFPRAAPYGIGAVAELGGVGGREGEWGTLRPVQVGNQWIEPGFSGAGVVVQDGEFGGRVIGIVVRDFVNGDARAAWMLPTETMLGHIPALRPFVAGEPTSVLPARGDGSAGSESSRVEDPGSLAMARELADLLGGEWAGTVVLTGGGTTGTSWLTALLLTGDPAARATADESAAAGLGTMLGFGSVDAAFDAAGASPAEVRTYLTDRFGLQSGRDDLAVQLLHRKPPVCLVISSVDRCLEPGSLLDSPLRELARGARWRGMRLVLGFDGEPPSDLPYEVSLGPVTGAEGGGDGARASRGEADEAVARLRAAEAEASSRYAEWELRFFAPPKPPRRVAPQLSIRCAAAAASDDRGRQRAEYAAIRDGAIAALDEVGRFRDAMERLIGRREDLVGTLELYRERAQRTLNVENPELTRLYGEALRNLWDVPIDLRNAQEAVARYGETVNRQIEDEPAADEPAADEGESDQDGGECDEV